MLTLPAFEYHAPKSLDEAIQLLSAHAGDVKVLAGGTDLLPNMKHRLFTPRNVVGLSSIEGLDQVREQGGALRLGAMLRIAQLAENEQVLARFPSLSYAASQIAGPQLRQMGTLGGNVCLDTRCVYYNQTYFWRKALGFCIKKDGTVCHVVKAGKKCVAAASNDAAPVLLTLGAQVRLVGPTGARELPLTEFYRPDGVCNTALGPDELLTEVILPLPKGRLVCGYEKLRTRAAVDYPALGVAVAATIDQKGAIEQLEVAVSALGARPHRLGGLEGFKGRPVEPPLIAEVGKLAYKQCHPLSNIDVDPDWRREVLPACVRRAFERALRPGP